MADLYSTPEEQEQLRAYGQALLGQPIEPALSRNPYAVIGPMDAAAHVFKQIQGRSTLNQVERIRKGQRQARADVALGRQPQTSQQISGVSNTQNTNVARVNQGNRADRNNNPGNLEYGPFARSMGATGSDGRFAIFPDMETGFRAQHALLANYMKKTNTVRSILAKWAPISEASNARAMDNYVSFVAGGLGVTPDTPLNPSQIPQLAKFIYQFESGNRGSTPQNTASAPAINPPLSPSAANIETSSLPENNTGDSEMMRLGGPEEGVTGKIGSDQIIQSGAIPPSAQPNQIQQPNQQIAQPNQQIAQADTQRLPQGIQPRIPPNPNLPMLERQLQNASLLDAQQTEELIKQYQSLAGPQAVDTPLGVAYYNGRTGELLYWTPKQFNQPISAGDVSTQQPMMGTPEGFSAIPIRPSGQNQGITSSGDGVNPNIESNTAPFPYGGNISDIANWSQRTRNQGEITRRMAEAQASRANNIITKGIESQEGLQLLNTIDTATKASASTRWTGETLSKWQSIVSTFLYNFDPNNTLTPDALRQLPYRELLQKLNAILASQATQEVSARGTNFEFGTFLRYNPNLINTTEGTLMLVDLLKQEKKKQLELGKIVERAVSGGAGNLLKIVDDYYDRNPIYINVPATNDVPAMRITTRRIPMIGEIKPDGSGAYNRQDVEAIISSLPENVWFINPRTGAPVRPVKRAHAQR